MGNENGTGQGCFPRGFGSAGAGGGGVEKAKSRSQRALGAMRGGSKFEISSDPEWVMVAAQNTGSIGNNGVPQCQGRLPFTTFRIHSNSSSTVLSLPRKTSLLVEASGGYTYQDACDSDTMKRNRYWITLAYQIVILASVTTEEKSHADNPPSLAACLSFHLSVPL